jgi:hypothetical protein
MTKPMKDKVCQYKTLMMTFQLPHSFLNKYYSRGREKVWGRERVRSAEVWALDHPFMETFAPDISHPPPLPALGLVLEGTVHRDGFG